MALYIWEAESSPLGCYYPGEIIVWANSCDEARELARQEFAEVMQQERVITNTYPGGLDRYENRLGECKAGFEADIAKEPTVHTSNAYFVQGYD